MDVRRGKGTFVVESPRSAGPDLAELGLRKARVTDLFEARLIFEPDTAALACRRASDEEIRKAARLAHLDSFIASLPDGYDALVSDDSDGISAGQKQLISISRIMLAEPEMLILDEATSSIDTRTEMMIQEAFMRLMKGRTSFIVAHRLSTIRSADLILVVKDGDVIESGTHHALMEKGGFYATMYKSQFSL